MTRRDAERQEAVEKLREWIKPGDTVYTIVRHVSRSGMQREIGIVLLSKEDRGMVDLHPNYLVAKALGERQGKRDGIIVGGCGMDMGFRLVYNLSRTLFGGKGEFGCIGEGCPSNDHGNGDRDYTPHMSEAERTGGADGKPCTCHREHLHSDGGYALKQRWL